jgi:hypothetical protein
MARGPFDAFVLFAEMRTGSNYLEATLNDLPDVSCYGEVFNPTFIGSHTQFELFGYDMDRRAADPLGLVEAMIAGTDGLPGFRLFHDHDDRVVAHVLPNPRIAKVILTRNPLDSYVSRKIAAATGQWRLTDLKHRRSARIRFDAEEFAEMIERLQAFQARLLRALQTTGQTAYYIRYEDIGDADVLSGLARFLGSEGRIDAASGKLKKQNPGGLEDKVENYGEMIEALAGFDRFGLGETPNFEPPRQPGVPGFVAHPEVGLLFFPIKGGPVDEVLDWMGRIGGVGRDRLLRRMSQKDLRQWMKAHSGYRSFAVLRHPLDRAHAVFNRFVLPADKPAYAEIRAALRQRYKLPLPPEGPDAAYDEAAHRAAFLAFLTFLKGNLAGQTSIRIDPAWASQTAILQGVSQVTLPHRLIDEAALVEQLPPLAAEAGISDAPPWPGAAPDDGPVPLSRIYDGKIEKAAIEVYRRDYLTFGFPRWNRR